MRSALLVPTLIVGWGGVLLGYDLALIRISISYVASEFNMNALIEEWVLFSSLVGCITGALLIGRRADFYGRRTLLMFLPLIYLVSAIGAGVSNNVLLFVMFRFIAGTSLGALAVIAPIYLSELSFPDLRGRVVATFPLFMTAGILLAVLSDYMTTDYGANNWRFMFIYGGVPAILASLLVLFIPESPRWLLQKGQERVARFIIRQVNPDADRDQVVEEIKESINIEIMASHAYLFKPPYLKRVMTGIALGFLNPLTGIIAIMHYAPGIFRSGGFNSSSLNVPFLATGLTGLVFTIVAIYFIDRSGRKKLLMIGSVGMSVTLSLLAIIAFLYPRAGYAMPILSIGFTGFYFVSQGTLIPVLFSELFPYNIRTRAASLGMVSLFFFSLIISYLVTRLEVIMTVGWIFVAFAAISALSFFFYRRFLDETKRRSLEEMEKEIMKPKPEIRYS